MINDQHLTDLLSKCGFHNSETPYISGTRSSFKALVDEVQAINEGRRGFIIKGWDADQLVRNLADMGEAFNVLRKLCEVFGMTLHCSDDVRYHLEAAVMPEYKVGAEITRMLTTALYPRNKWLDYSMTFRMHTGGSVEIASPRVVERNVPQQSGTCSRTCVETMSCDNSCAPIGDDACGATP